MSMPTSDPAARIVKLDYLAASPASCALCGKATHPDGFAYFGLDFEWFGTLYFCADCAGETARLFGYISPTQAKQLLYLADELRAETTLLHKQLDDLGDIRDLVNNYLDKSARDNVDIAPVIELLSAPNIEPDVSVIEQPDEPAAETKPESVESLLESFSVERSDGVPDGFRNDNGNDNVFG